MLTSFQRACKLKVRAIRLTAAARSGWQATRTTQASVKAMQPQDPGQTSWDGNGRSGVHTKHLLKHPATPKLDLNALFARAANGVEDKTEGKQNRWQLMATSRLPH